MNSYYSKEELKQLKLKSIGKNVLISRNARFYGVENISIGDNVRIDDFTIISGRVEIGDHVHIAQFVGLFGGIKGVYIGDFVNISSRVYVYALSDDFSGETLAGPIIPEEYRNVVYSPVNIADYCIVGTGSTILPGSHLAEGTSVGAMSLIKGKTDPWHIYVGIPARIIGKKSENAKKLGERYKNEQYH